MHTKEQENGMTSYQENRAWNCQRFTSNIYDSLDETKTKKMRHRNLDCK
jgi:hypothetical protein